MPRVIVAADKFKGSLGSDQVAAAVGAGVRRVRPDAVVDTVPVADGGDGTLAAAVAAGFELVPRTVSGPTGEPVRSGYARRGDLAVVELADACGLVRLPAGVPAPMTATSYGAGELVAAAVEAGCSRVILGIGGSASTDGGAGLIRALGGRLLDLTELRKRLAGVEIVVACDVDNPLTGPAGAAAMYGPQKGADAGQVAALDRALGNWADLVAAETGRDLRDVPGAGAAGGVGFAALAVLGAELRPGIELMLDLVGFHHRLAGADLVITGEGSLDEQSLRGKAVTGVAAAAAGVPVVAVCGTNRLDAAQLRAAGIGTAYALTDLEPDVERCIAEPIPLLRRLGERIALTIEATERGIA